MARVLELVFNLIRQSKFAAAVSAVALAGLFLIPGNAAASETWQGPPSFLLKFAQPSAPANVQLAQAKKPGGDDLLLEEIPEDKKPAAKKPEEKPKTAEEEHAALFAESKFPAATTCGTCHPRHFKEWSVSQHSYAQLIPTDVIHDTLAHFRRVMEASRSGMVRRSFQAMQQASTMAS